MAAVARFSSVALLEPTVTLISCSLPSRKTVIVTSVPGRMVLTRREGSVTEEVTFLPLERKNDVALTQACLFGGAVLFGLRHEGALRRLEAEAVGELLIGFPG